MPGHKSSAFDALHRSPSTKTTMGHAQTGAGGNETSDSNSFAANSLHSRVYSPGGGGNPQEHGDAAESFLQEGGTTSPFPRLHGAGGLRAAKYDFGRLGGMVKFQHLVGDVLGNAVGMPGDTLSLEIGAEVSVEGIILGLDLKASAARDDEGFSMSGRFDMKLGIGEVGDSGKIGFFAGLEASGDTSRECADLMGLGLEQTIREKQFHASDLLSGDFYAGVLKDIGLMSATGGASGIFSAATRIAGDAIADALWGRDYSAFVLQNMDEDDQVSRTIGGGMEGDLEGLNASVEYEHRDVIGAENGELKKWGENDLNISVGYKHKAPPFEFSASLSAVLPLDPEQRTAKGKFKIKASNKDSMGDNVDAGVLLHNGVIDAIKGLCTQSGKLDTGWVGKLVDGASKALDAAMGVVAGASDVTYSLSIDSTGKVKFAVTSESSAGADVDLKEKLVGVKVDIGLERTLFETSFDVGPMKPAKAMQKPQSTAGAT